MLDTWFQDHHRALRDAHSPEAIARHENKIMQALITLRAEYWRVFDAQQRVQADLKLAEIEKVKRSAASNR